MGPSPVAELKRNFVAHDAPVNQVVTSLEDGTIATADVNLQVRVWRSGEMVQELDVRSMLDKVRPTERVRGLAFSPDCSTLYVAAGQWVNAYSITGTIEPLWSFIAPTLFAFLVVSPTDVTVGLDGRVAATFDNGSLVIFDPAGSVSETIRHNAVPKSIVAASNGSFVGADAFSVSAWEAGKKSPTKHLKVRERIYAFASSSAAEVVAVRHLFTTQVLALQSGAELATYEQGRGLPLLKLDAAGEVLAVGTQHAVTLHKITSPRRTATLTVDDAELVSLGFASRGREIIAGCSDGRVRVWHNELAE